MKKSMRVSLLAAVTVVMLCKLANAQFMNGGFEMGNFNGWSLAGTGASLSSVISASTPMLNGQTTDINPYYGNYMARLQNLAGGNHYTTLSQSSTLVSADLNETLYVGWGAMLIEPGNHSVEQQPDFSINILKNGVTIDSFSADARTKQGGGWVPYGYLGGTAWYKSGVFSSALSAFSAGDLLSISISINDCSQGGHGGVVFLDGIGTMEISNMNDPVPEPATLLLFGTGIAGLVGNKLRRKK